MTTGQMYIGGKWTGSISGETREIICPSDGRIIAKVAEGSAEDVRRAVKEARKAFDSGCWSKAPVLERRDFLNKTADMIDGCSDMLMRLETLNTGKPFRDSAGDIADAANCFRYYAGLINKPTGQVFEVPDPNMQTMAVREPVGVCGQIVPWNYPLLMAAWKLAPALAAGNTVVFKPAEITPLTAIKLFEMFEKAGLPAGVANLVLGSGAEAGHEIAVNHGIDKVAFTGGTKTGRSIMQAATENIKNISLELGGKSPCIVFDDYDMESAVEWAMFAIFANQGEVCSAGSRLILQDTIYDKFLKRLAERTKKIKVARGETDGCEMGPVISETQMDKVLSYIEKGKKEGARLLCGGCRMTDGDYAKGFFVAPTVFADCTPGMSIVRDEIFGPVLAVQKFHTEEEAVALANDTPYGLAGGVITKDISRAMRVVKALRAGITWVNCYNPTFNEAPWGGYKQSGTGRELGTFGLEEYTEVKQININLSGGGVDWFAD